MTNGAYVNVWERHDTLEFSFPFPYDPSVMTRDEIVRRLIENERDARRWSVLPRTAMETLSRSVLRCSRRVTRSGRLLASSSPPRAPPGA